MQQITRTGAPKALAIGVLSALAFAPAAGAQTSTATGELAASQGVRKALSGAGATEHLKAFQGFSDTSGGNRVGGSLGFEKSATYVKQKAADAGLVTSDNTFQFLYNADATPPTLRREAPAPVKAYVDGVEYASMTFSESVTTTTRSVTAVDLVLDIAGKPASTSHSGCEPADFAGFPIGSIALVQRGTCDFGVKSANAKAAGAVATIVMNEGNAGRTGIINGTLGGPNRGPAVGATSALGFELANGVGNGPTGTTATIKIDRVQENRTTRNVIAETPDGDPDSVIVVGAHLDSVPRGAGINDNGTGSAGVLEIAETLRARGIAPRQKIRFMWYSAEEFGLLGSRAYVDGLPEAERKKIKAMLNFDMIGSPNYVRFVYDGDNSGFPIGPNAAKGPQGSGELERIFRDYFAGVGLTSGETPFSGRSDYGPFIAAGVDIPAGGLFTGAEGVKTTGQARVYGGEAGVAYDKCYHLACDDLSNVNAKGYDEMLDAAGHATYTVVMRNLVKNPLLNPASPVSGTDGLTPSGGGLHEDHDHEDEES